MGYLPAGEMAYLLAAQLVARGSKDEMRHVTKDLETTQADLLHQAIAELGKSRERLLADLGLPAARTWPQKRELDPFVRPLEPRTEEQYDDAPPREVGERDVRHQGAPVFRVRMRQTGRFMAFGLLAGTVMSAMAARDGQVGLALVVLAASSGVGGLFGRRVVRYECSNCERYVTRDETTCFGCGGLIKGTIGDRSDRYDAEEAFQKGTFRSLE